MANKLYDKNSIESLSPLEFTRLRPGVYAGNTTYSTQLLVEILSNAVDEFNAGHGNTIKITLKGKTIIVEDNGQGFLVNEVRDDGKTILEAAFSVLNTSGKYREDGTYEGTSLGSFGIGSKITTYLSHWLEVITYRDNKYEHIWFKEGEFYDREVGTSRSNKTGTIVSWEPSEEFFTNVEVELPKVKELLKTISCLCPGLTIELDDNGKKITYKSEKGLTELVDDQVKDTELISNRFNLKFNENKYRMDMVLTYTSSYSSNMIAYINTGLTERGPHITQIKGILTREFNKFFRDKKWLKEKDENLSGDDIQEGMYIIFNLTTSGVQYDAQVKSRITQIDMGPFSNVIIDNLRFWLENNEKEVKIIADKAINARRAREAAKKARDAARNKNEKKKKALKFDSKLADSNYHGPKAEIMITEGDSASGNLKLARDNDYQAVLPIRGKLLNVRKANIDKIQKNAEIMTMIEAFGLSVDSKTMKLTFKPEDLRYGKIIIMSDADVSNTAYERLFA